MKSTRRQTGRHGYILKRKLRQAELEHAEVGKDTVQLAQISGGR